MADILICLILLNISCVTFILSSFAFNTYSLYSTFKADSKETNTITKIMTPIATKKDNPTIQYIISSPIISWRGQ